MTTHMSHASDVLQYISIPSKRPNCIRVAGDIDKNVHARIVKGVENHDALVSTVQSLLTSLWAEKKHELTEAEFHKLYEAEYKLLEGVK